MQVSPTDLPGVLEITPARHGDHRGFFTESWNRETLRAAGIDIDFCQDNHSLSVAQYTLRGLHFQKPPHAQDKLVRVIAGAVRDVAVDLRVGSETYGQWTALTLTAETGNQLLVPKGFAHGFLTLTPNVQVIYKCSETYAPDHDAGIRWDDPSVAIDWGIDAGMLTLSDKDRAAPLLAEIDPPFPVGKPL